MSNPLNRWWRSRTDVIATFAAALALIAVNALAGQAVVHINAALDANWRGAYDILVTPLGQDFGGSKTRGLVDSNFVSDAGTGGISLGQLKKIRAIDDVGVAAPIGMVGTLRDLSITPSLYIPDNPATHATALSDTPELLRLTTTLERTDHGTDQTLSKTTGYVAIQARQQSAASLISAAALTSVSSPTGFGAQTDDYSFQVPLGQLPAFPTAVIAVDPAAEAKLWKGKANYLAPLENASAARSAKSSGAKWASQVDPKKFLVQQSNLQSAATDPNEQNDSVIPLVVNSSSRADLSVKVTIDKAPLNGALPADSSAVQTAAAAASWTSVGAASANASAVTKPFASPSLSLQWPGTSKPAGESGGVFYLQATSLAPSLVDRPDYTSDSASGQTPRFTVKPGAVTGPDGAAPGGEFAGTSGADPDAGKTRAYRTATNAGGTGFGATLPAPIGTFTSSQAQDAGTMAASYVPSGIGGGQDPTVATPAPGSGVQAGSAVQASLSNLDFLNAAPGAFTDLQGGAQLRGSTPIDAVRIRVSGVHGYTAQSRQRIAAVAQQIAKLGLSATVVAGSSLQPVSVYVPKYLFSGSSSTDLGWVDEEWTTLGASVTVAGALTASTVALSITAAVAVALALFATQILTARRRRAEVGLLRTIGWRRGAIRQRVFLGYLPGVVIILLAAVVSLALTSGGISVLAGSVSASLVAAAFLAAMLGASRSMGAERPQRRRRTLPHPSTGRELALRHLRTTPGSTLVQGFGVLLFVATVATGIQALIQSRSAAGQTRLAGVVFHSGAAPLIVLIATAAVASLLLCLLGRRSESLRRRAEQAVLRASGFTARQRARIRQWEVLTIALSSGVIATAAAAVAAALLGTGPALVLSAALSALVAVAVLSSAARKES